MMLLWLHRGGVILLFFRIILWKLESRIKERRVSVVARLFSFNFRYVRTKWVPRVFADASVGFYFQKGKLTLHLQQREPRLLVTIAVYVDCRRELNIMSDLFHYFKIAIMFAPIRSPSFSVPVSIDAITLSAGRTS